jgi:hypothetical protein
MTVATNLGTGGAVLDAQYGSAPTPNSNEPLLLGHTGENYLYLPGVAGNYASTPDAAALDITGDIDIRVRVAMDDWTPAADIGLVSKWNGAVTQSAYLFNVNSGSGRLSLYWSTNGTTVSNSISTVSPTISDGAALWVRVTFDVDNGSGGNDVAFFTAPDQATEPSSWTQLGTTVTTAGTTSIFNSTAPLEVGSWQGGVVGNAAAKFYRAIVRDGIGGTVAFDADFTTGITSGAQTTFTESSSNAATVTINRSASGRKSVAVVRPTWLLGSDDYFEVPDNALLDFGASDSFSVVAVYRQWGTPADGDRILSKESGGGASAGWALLNNGGVARPYLQIADGVTSDNNSSTATTVSFGALIVTAAVRNVSTDRLVMNTNNTTNAGEEDNTTGSFANASPLRIGSYALSVVANLNAELLAVAVFRRALTAGELSTIATYYGAI